ncbi:MAG: UDP-N-acetylmuramoyl-tripeptide--D-alanyl-D-alanine ligase [Rikenellaceae bacterium]
MIETIYKLFERYPRISTDTRRIEPSSLFFALRGASFNGNEFALAALRMGAAYAIVDDETLVAQNPCVSSKLICVDDVLRTLQLLAAHHRRVLDIPIIAITGSNGKTTTKELLCAVLSTRYRVSATVGNLNNHIGVPLTLLSMDPLTEIGIVEMGANARGEIAALCQIAAPNFGIINNVGRAHLEGFGGEEGIKKGKGELYDFLSQTQGVAFVASDDPTLIEMSQQREGLSVVEYPFALASGIKHQLEGGYNLKNIASAVAVATFFRVEREDIASVIGLYTPQNNRSQRCVTDRNTLIVDCYNANPSSMEVSIKNFLGESTELRKVMILGDMYELGGWSREEHQRVIRLAASQRGVEVLLVGSNFAEAYKELGDLSMDVRLFGARADLEGYLSASVYCSSMILIKGSRGVGLEQIIKLL